MQFTKMPSLPISALSTVAVLLAALWPSALPAGDSGSAPASDEVAVAEPAQRQVVLTGFTRAAARLPLASESAGRVLEVLHDIGDRVGEAGVFARIDGTFLRLELEQIQVRQGRLGKQIAYDQREVARYRELARRDNAAASQLDALEQTLINNRSERDRLDVERRVVEERLRRAEVPAPPGWRITGRQVEPGQWVQAGEVIGEAADFRTLLVPFSLTAEQLEGLQWETTTDSGLELKLADLGEVVPAKICRENPGFDAETRKSRVELRLRPPEGRARGGLRALLRLAVPEPADTVLLPTAAVHESYDEHLVQPLEGDAFPVVVLGELTTPDGEARLRVRAPRLRAGQRFRLAGPR